MIRHSCWQRFRKSRTTGDPSFGFSKTTVSGRTRRTEDLIQLTKSNKFGQNSEAIAELFRSMLKVTHKFSQVLENSVYIVHAEF